eukprot:5410979-Amphidinium_carterae.1
MRRLSLRMRLVATTGGATWGAALSYMAASQMVCLAKEHMARCATKPSNTPTLLIIIYTVLIKSRMSWTLGNKHEADKRSCLNKTMLAVAVAMIVQATALAQTCNSTE